MRLVAKLAQTHGHTTGLLCLAESLGGLVHDVRHNSKIDMHVKSTE